MRQAMRLGLSMCAVVACACSSKSDSPTGTSDTGVLGAYKLTAVNGGALPGIYTSDASSRTMLDSATIRLSAGNLYSDTRSTRVIDNTGEHPSTDTRTGTYTETGDQFSFAYTNGIGIPATQAATLSGSTLTLVEGSVTLTFKK